jgi:hypothetical protein
METPLKQPELMAADPHTPSLPNSDQPQQKSNEVSAASLGGVSFSNLTTRKGSALENRLGKRHWR